MIGGYLSGSDVLGTVSAAPPKVQIVDGKSKAGAATPVRDVPSSEISPAVLAELDRALTPAEYERVAAWQAGVMDLLQKEEEAKPGSARVDYIPGPDAPRKQTTKFIIEPVSRPAPPRVPSWLIPAGLGAVAALLGGAVLLGRK